MGEGAGSVHQEMIYRNTSGRMGLKCAQCQAGEGSVSQAKLGVTERMSCTLCAGERHREQEKAIIMGELLSLYLLSPAQDGPWFPNTTSSGKGQRGKANKRRTM
jgi:hypothetical protein